jgi:stage V sporulation protein G
MKKIINILNILSITFVIFKKLKYFSLTGEVKNNHQQTFREEKMKIVRMNKLDQSGGGKLTAFFDIETNDEIIIKGFRLVTGSNGLFISSPDEKGKDGKYYDTVILPKEMKQQLEKMAIEEYNK